MTEVKFLAFKRNNLSHSYNHFASKIHRHLTTQQFPWMLPITKRHSHLVLLSHIFDTLFTTWTWWNEFILNKSLLTTSKDSPTFPTRSRSLTLTMIRNFERQRSSIPTCTPVYFVENVSKFCRWVNNKKRVNKKVLPKNTSACKVPNIIMTTEWNFSMNGIIIEPTEACPDGSLPRLDHWF